MAKITFDGLTGAVNTELQTYSSEVIKIVNDAGDAAVKKLVDITKKTAPKRSGKYAKAITSEKIPFKSTGEMKYVWGAKPPFHRLTHLLVNGHAKKNGGRVPGDSFLFDALETVADDYLRDVERGIKGNG